MKYSEHLATFSPDTHCPFCQFSKEEILEETRYFFVIPARAPYGPDHLLIIPKRHVILLKELKKAELNQLRQLTLQRNARLQQHHKGTSILIRDTISRAGMGKSINHLHLHIIPNCYIGAKENEQRTYFSDKKYLQEVTKMKKKYT
jgi:diadenosine tetraphosphate (Ap4A) HIT family hydrolase